MEETAMGGKIDEVGRAPQQESIRDGTLQVPMWPLDRTVLVGNPAVVAARRHDIMKWVHRAS